MDSTQSMMAQDTKNSPSELYTTFFNDMFVLKASAMIGGQPAEIDFSKNDELSLRCHSPELNLCFREMSMQLGTLLRKYGVCQVNSIWCGAEPFIHVSYSCRHFDRRMHVASLTYISTCGRDRKYNYNSTYSSPSCVCRSPSPHHTV